MTVPSVARLLPAPLSWRELFWKALPCRDGTWAAESLRPVSWEIVSGMASWPPFSLPWPLLDFTLCTLLAAALGQLCQGAKDSRGTGCPPCMPVSLKAGQQREVLH